MRTAIGARPVAARNNGAMLRAALRIMLRRLGSRYPRVVLALVFGLTFPVALGGAFLLDLYVDLRAGQFWRVVAVTESAVALEVVAALWVAFKHLRPADPWLRGERTPGSAAAAWRALAGLPLDLIRYARGLPIALNIVPLSLYLAVELDRPLFPSVLVIGAGVVVALAYAMFLRFFGIELTMRPLLERISADLPDGVEPGRTTVPLRWRLLVGLPVINVITGVTVVGLATDEPSLRALGVAVLIALAVAFTISFYLSLLLLRSIVGPIQDLQEGTRRVAAGDLSARVPVMGSDETGGLAASFNGMVAGLEERERLREAFGAFVDPSMVDRVMGEGAGLDGEEVEVTVLFLDIRGFTAFAERASAQEVVAELNRFYELIVPVLLRHGGHANKFVGDGVLAVFGAPEPLPYHADWGVAAALEIADVVRDEYDGELRIGVGVNSGPVVSGTLGGGGRLEFTVIGDTVNIAARVEEVTRATGDDVLVTEFTRALLHEDYGGFLERGSVPLKGRAASVQLYAPVAAGAESRADASAAARDADGRWRRRG